MLDVFNEMDTVLFEVQPKLYGSNFFTFSLIFSAFISARREGLVVFELEEVTHCICLMDQSRGAEVTIKYKEPRLKLDDGNNNELFHTKGNNQLAFS